MKRILIIDDAEMMRKLLKRILTIKGYSICGEAKDGQEGIEKFRLLQPDLVFLDIIMSGLNGMDCLREILKIDPNAKVIMCTSTGQDCCIDEALQIGAKEFIVKPVNAAEVVRVTESVLESDGTSSLSINYRTIMEERAREQGLSLKHILDFFESFKLFTKMNFDQVDSDYLRKNRSSTMIGVRALLSPKMSMENVDKLMTIYSELE